jgi:hypothetical protein
MMTRVFLILCCLGILVAGSGCYVYTAPAGGYYDHYPRRHHHHHHRHRPHRHHDD